MPCVDICNGTLLDTLNRKNLPLRQIHPIASVAQIESGIEDLPGILTIDAGIMGIQIKYTASKAASGTPEDILLQMDSNAWSIRSGESGSIPILIASLSAVLNAIPASSHNR